MSVYFFAMRSGKLITTSSSWAPAARASLVSLVGNRLADAHIESKCYDLYILKLVVQIIRSFVEANHAGNLDVCVFHIGQTLLDVVYSHADRLLRS